jgi:DNA-binding NarL/FixJ family response regulator
MNTKITIAILEDVQEQADRLEQICAADPELLVVGKYSSAEEAIPVTCQVEQHADVYVVDLGLPGLNGTSFIAAARDNCPKSKFVVHTVCESSQGLLDALAVGAHGYILKGSSPEEICVVLKIIAKGGSIIGPRMADKLLRFFDKVVPPRQELTVTELEILRKLKTGMTYAAIAEAKCISPHTVHTHIKNMYTKLSVNSREEAVRNAVFFRLID